MEKALQKVLVLTGPTASGKSGLALRLAEALDAVIINADALQVYRDLDLLTARPSKGDLDRIPHRLYGVLTGNERCSAGRWRRMALAMIRQVASQGRVPLIVGGTGLYIKALQEGIAPLPEVPKKLREEGNALYQQMGGKAFKDLVLPLDPTQAQLWPDSDAQRLVRAWEVAIHTGKSLTQWQQEGKEQRSQQQAESSFDYRSMALMPDRDRLYDNCNWRFDRMMDQGALKEAKTLLQKDYPRDLPIMKSLGVPELASFLRGERSLEEARTLAQRNTRRYAKRQMTWIRNQFPDYYFIGGTLSDSLFDQILDFVQA